jgi:hypothetical protein
MPLVVSRHPQTPGLFIPVILCDFCGERIERATEGNYSWGEPDEETGHAAVSFAHKQCQDALDAAQGARADYCEGLTRLPLYLAANLDQSLSDMRKVQQVRREFGI